MGEAVLLSLTPAMCLLKEVVWPGLRKVSHKLLRISNYGYMFHIMIFKSAIKSRKPQPGTLWNAIARTG